MSPWILKSHRATACFFYAHLRNIIFDSWQFKPLLIPSSASRCFCSHLSVQMYWLFFSDVFCCTVKIIGIPVNSIPDIPVISIPWSTVQDTGRFCLPLWSPYSALKKRSLIKWMGLQRSKKKIKAEEAPSPTVPPTADASSALDKPWLLSWAAVATGRVQGWVLLQSCFKGGNWKKKGLRLQWMCQTAAGYAWVDGEVQVKGYMYVMCRNDQVAMNHF